MDCMSLPRLILTLGDPAGIGPEVVLKALAEPGLASICQLTAIGSRSVLDQTRRQLLAQNPGLNLADPETINLLEVDLSYLGKITVGQGDAVSGAISFAYLNEAITRTLAGEFDAIVTAPIAKSAWQAAGHNYPGQTEVLAHRAGVESFAMAFVGRSPFTGWTLRTLLATTHIPLKEVPQALTPQLMTAKLELLLTCLAQDFGISNPSVAIAGLNPHSGEEGKLGSEEQDWLIPWLEQARKKYPQAQLIGPIPPDTMWVGPGKAWLTDGQTTVSDAYLALYHDQGLIPVKLLAFDQAINTTIGLPFVRTSPDHGTAFDIAGQGIARADSLIAAIKLAAELVEQRCRPRAQ
ncbi:pyridoxal phosphate biosynthetic protein; PdxA [Synechocystis sp. PCC 6803]|uniref:4-hydroxythreonine-4-phosphate dehydrogenase n=1 Tax=Synechocystis sp. (strain ATCC 27184 / PCC 6803 / Kazusa) TaxID=1111708 RepID=PDXA_SYNY3|nr:MULTISPECIES: 4-hydroxythreonine-4-phosphate dehydrogenase PdxA [unclassified Synechocystis]Q55982.1 RecName: Full=4-hydroxythreonine-4-phosphate dehydrogenase; AltName: Full=4-(phosphohydroxy)-L-threonine dehydrogenase [Synechocystis sp. PCC 6803 substr. Kazusa]AGF53053.1 pyridoxal phosphate biosynthetic protein PdxA [Synechocystis sp. PCC 6803]ALJ68937.1 4-hydroxythreonine-4-phosphate dehydrogenase [Synechocystis sp. PCC 6803]AVP90801.1 4-hydroxythreonine-4-phosphate dehydrogenase PdxA [Sy